MPGALGRRSVPLDKRKLDSQSSVARGKFCGIGEWDVADRYASPSVDELECPDLRLRLSFEAVVGTDGCDAARTRISRGRYTSYRLEKLDRIFIDLTDLAATSEILKYIQNNTATERRGSSINGYKNTIYHIPGHLMFSKRLQTTM